MSPAAAYGIGPSNTGQSGIRALSILWDNRPNICRFAPFRVVLKEVEALVAQFLSASRYSLVIGMRCPLLSTDNHAEVRQITFRNVYKNVA